MKIKKKSLGFLAMVVACLLLIVGCSSGGSETSSTSGSGSTPESSSSETSEGETSGGGEGLSAVRIGTSSSGSVFYGLAIAASEIFEKYTDINSTVEPVGGSDPNMFAIHDKKIELGVANAFAAQNAYNGAAPYTEPVNVSLVAQGQASFRQILVRTDAGIDSPEDLEGKTIIASRPPLPELELIANAMFEAYGLDTSTMKLVSTANTTETDEALAVGSADAALYPASLGSPLLNELTASGKVKFLEISDEKLKEMAEILPSAIIPGVIPAGTYTNQDQDINAFYFNTYLVAGGDVPNETAYELTKALFDNHEEFAQMNKAAEEWTLEATLDNPSIPFHDGSIQYFKEVGAWNDELQAVQDSLKK
ncbi:TAXI family TRAP transporter solute-binding subunit [Bacillus sp. Marseille-P3661]|uniref:TAXI family TRAP transporter solute-binding subunit n=1 Tax=Bacillus sp. Marseille-P3661 TaxID=1936234 RepID=UPI000C81E77F|nr:TAXI family TRAP transporter solute-binding subunit [Bacillus sp. Marseille-P3661]